MQYIANSNVEMSKAKIPVAEAGNNATKFPVKNRKTSIRTTAANRSQKAPKKTAARKKSGQKKVRDSSTKGAQAKHSQAESAAAGATLEDARQTSEQILGANPVVGFDGREVLGAINGLFRLMAVRPDLVIREQIGLLTELMQVAIGDSVVAPDPGDRRFRHEIWQKSPFFKRVMQSYLAWRKSLFNILDSSNASDREKERARFALGLFTEAVAPTNTLLGNPGAVKRMVETRGKSLLYGARNMLDDLLNNGGMPKQVDESQFKVGHNLAATPGSVVFRNEVLELIQYRPTSKQVFNRPLLLIPPQINKFYIVDLSPGRSFAEYAVRHGMQLFAISWRNPTAAQKDWNLETYLAACKEAMDAVCEITGHDDLSIIAACAGGYTAAALLGHLAAANDQRVHNITLLVTVLDTDCPTLMTLFSTKAGIAAAIQRSRSKGVLEGRDMARIFAWLRPNDLIWPYVANNWLMGNKPPAFDVLAWNADSTRLPAEFHADLLSMSLHNPLAYKDKLKVLGTPIDMSKVTQDNYVIAGITDHITPWKACYETRNILPGKTEFVLSSSGHIQAIVNPPGNPRAKFYTNDDLSLDADDWLAGAGVVAGSWWDHWQQWYAERGNGRRNAPKALGNKNYPPMDDAPGRYVHQK
jgi:polyhydroxyalkanoate synthase